MFCEFIRLNSFSIKIYKISGSGSNSLRRFSPLAYLSGGMFANAHTPASENMKGRSLPETQVAHFDSPHTRLCLNRLFIVLAFGKPSNPSGSQPHLRLARPVYKICRQNYCDFIKHIVCAQQNHILRIILYSYQRIALLSLGINEYVWYLL